MFTGIITEVGRVVAAEADGTLAIEAPRTAAGLGLGGSVAINGACLTAVELNGPEFRVQAVDETRRRTTLGGLAPGARVNLELPVTAGQPLDGHLVQGHVDGTGGVLKVTEVRLGRELDVSLPDALARYVTEKGSIAVDGVSLTVVAVNGDRFRAALIPHTLAVTIAGDYQVGTMVNLEVDLMARYLERLVRPRIERG